MVLSAKDAAAHATKKQAKQLENSRAAISRAVDRAATNGRMETHVGVEKHLASVLKEELLKLGYRINEIDNLGDDEINFHIGWSELK